MIRRSRLYPHTMRPLRAIHLLVALLATSAVAHAWDSANSDLPAGDTIFNGNGSRASGVVQTYNIPLTNFPETIHFYARGADGGNADAGPSWNKDKFQGKGGGGAIAEATFQIWTSGLALRPGGESRIIVGNKGAHKQGSSGGTRVAAGG